MKSVRVHLNWNYILAFLFLTMLCGLSHEMVHHFTAAGMCGCWGYKTFNSFELCESCGISDWNLLATAAGPIFTFLLMWIGWFKLRSSNQRSRQIGFALIFANFPINRILFAFMGFNDEQFIAVSLFGDSLLAYWATNTIVLLFSVPPLFSAYHRLQNSPKLLWFLGFLIVPFLFVFLFAGLFLENFLLLDLKILSEAFWRIPLLLLLVEVICVIGYRYTNHFLYDPHYNVVDHRL